MTNPKFSKPEAIAEEGERIYQERYKADFEASHSGWFVLIDVSTGVAYAAPGLSEAVNKARTEAPHGIFHLLKVGEPGAFRVSYRSDAGPARLAR